MLPRDASLSDGCTLDRCRKNKNVILVAVLFSLLPTYSDYINPDDCIGNISSTSIENNLNLFVKISERDASLSDSCTLDRCRNNRRTNDAQKEPVNFAPYFREAEIFRSAFFSEVFSITI